MEFTSGREAVIDYSLVLLKINNFV